MDAVNMARLNGMMSQPKPLATANSLDSSSRVATNVDEKKAAETQKVFQQFVGETFFGEMLKQMRKSVPESEYFNGGHGEKVFRQQLDQMISQKMAETSAQKLSEPMYELFQLRPGK